MTIPRFVLGFVGAVAIVLSLGGIYYNYQSFAVVLAAPINNPEEPYFGHAFFSMSAICVAAYLLLFYIGVQFVRGRTNLVWSFTLLMAAEFLYFFAVGALWMLPEYGMSIAGATGVANGGLMLQWIILFPFWAPAIAFFASRSLKAQNEPDAPHAQNSV